MYYYFVAFRYDAPKHSGITGNLVITSNVKVDGIDIIRQMEEYIQRDFGFRNACITNYQLMREE